MKHAHQRALCVVLSLFLMFGIFAPAVCAAEVTDEQVLAVIRQLEAIDSLQQMQDNRSNYKVTSNHYDSGTTDAAIAAEHEAARAGYESYISMMFSARMAAQQAYDALTPEQQAQIDPALTAKLTDTLSTTFRDGTYPVTPRSDAYTFEAVNGGAGYGYEIGNHMVSGNIPQTFILVDTANGETSWTPDGLYVCGESNYEVTYCCDVQTPLEYSTHYRRLNLEDSNYYGADASRHIRAILQSSYPYVTMDEMKANLKAGGLDAEFVDGLTRADMISAVQMAIWTYANAGDLAGEALGYFASVNVPKNTGLYFTPLHDYTNETWEWQPGKRQRSYDAAAAYRVNSLAYYLCNLPGVSAADNEIVISDVEVTRADLIPGSDDTYRVGMYVRLNNGGDADDDLKVTITSYRTDESGKTVVTARSNQQVAGRTELEMYVRANNGDTVKVTVEGTQTLGKGVYFYEPEGGRSASQCLVGVAEGQTNVYAEEVFTFEETIEEMGLRIYKTTTDTGAPLSGITFHIYHAVPAEGESLRETPTDAEITAIAIPENLAGSVTTDATGYAELALDEGTYLVVEEHNAAKVVAPVTPFYVTLPMTETVTAEDGTVTTVTNPVVSVYPKNEPNTPPELPPPTPPSPDLVTGSFELLKFDQADRDKVLAGAEFAVYRPATESDTNTTIILCEGVEYAVVPVLQDGVPLVLTTGEDGRAVSPELACGPYFLMETKAPDGYNLLNRVVPVTVYSNLMTTVAPVEIPNERGSILPETGGIGTAGFLLIGGLLAVVTAVLLVTKKRMQDSRAGDYELF